MTRDKPTHLMAGSDSTPAIGKSGRPVTRPKIPRTKFSLRVSLAELEAWRQAAQAEDRSVAAWLKRLANQAVKKAIDKPGKQA